MIVTAVITTYKREPSMVEKALKSILAQTHKNIQIIVVDDSPSDYPLRCAVKDMVEQYEGVTYVAHERNSGACVARNTGLALAEGDFIAFLDDDDEWLPTRIEEQLKGFTNESVGLVYSKALYENVSTGEVGVVSPRIITKNFYGELFTDNYVGSTSFPLLKTSALKDVGGFDPLMPAAQDYDTWIRVAQKYSFAYIDLPLTKYHIHDGDQITKNLNRKISGINRIIQKHADYLKQHPKSLAELQLYLSSVSALMSENKEAFKYLFNAIKLHPLNFKKNLVGFGRIVKSLFGGYKGK